MGDNELSLKLIGHEIEGQPQPAGDAVIAVRVEVPADDVASSAGAAQAE
jgi:hypothetical protein